MADNCYANCMKDRVSDLSSFEDIATPTTVQPLFLSLLTLPPTGKYPRRDLHVLQGLYGRVDDHARPQPVGQWLRGLDPKQRS